MYNQQYFLFTKTYLTKNVKCEIAASLSCCRNINHIKPSLYVSQSSNWKIQAVRSALDCALDGFEFHCELTLHNSHQYQHQKLTSEVHQEILLLDKLNYPHASSFIFVVFSPVHKLERNSFTLKTKSEFILEREKP